MTYRTGHRPLEIAKRGDVWTAVCRCGWRSGLSLRRMVAIMELREHTDEPVVSIGDQSLEELG